MSADDSAFKPGVVEEVLAEVFGFHSFRPHQEEIVRALLAGRDVFAVMPTGGGKSLCYQLPARLLPGAAVVVSPLIALMKDQVDNARAMGLAAGALNSSSQPWERAETWERLAEGRLDLLYVSPERLMVPDFLESLARFPLSFFAIDEAHCVSEWGHDFRPDYLGLNILAERFPHLPLAAFTATATHRVAGDITERLGLRSPLLVRASFNRPNLYYQAALRDNLEKRIMEVVDMYPGESGLVYRSTRKKVEETAVALAKRGLSVRPYHAGMDDEERRSAQDDFQRDRCQVIVATVAFGMGIDKSNVRFVIHGDLPKNLESYYQETGRAGRDGEPAHCVLFYGPQEMVLWRRFAEEMPEANQRRAALEQLRQMIDYAQRDACRRRTLLGYFGEESHEEDCGGCDICRGEVERVEATVPAQMALSAMVRTGGRFGSAHLADLLVGGDTVKIRANNHHLLPTYGVGREYDRGFWRDLMAALLARGLAENAGDAQYPTLAAAPRSRPVLRGEEKFYMLRTAVREKVRRRSAAALAAEEGLGDFSEGLWQRLREIRKQRAEADGIPPYMVFSDRSLREMAQRKPASSEEFLDITGVGRHKLEIYGHNFLEVIADYVREHPEEARTETERGSDRQGEMKVGRRMAAKTKPTEGESGRESHAPRGRSGPEPTEELLRQGLSLDEVAEIRGLVRSTIIHHLEQLILAGESFASDRIIDGPRLAEIGRAFEAVYGDEDWVRLKPVVEGSEAGISYDEARVARALLKPYAPPVG